MIIAEIKDIPKVLPLIEAFIKESGWGYTYNEANSASLLERFIAADDCDVIVEEGKAFAIVAHEDEFHDERLGYLVKFYVMPESRGTGLGRELIGLVSDWFDYNKCFQSFATATAMVGEDKLYINLLGKKGFRECGATLVRDYGKA